MVCEKNIPCSERVKQRLAADSGIDGESHAVKAWTRRAVAIGEAPHVGITEDEAKRIEDARAVREAAGRQDKGTMEPVAQVPDASKPAVSDISAKKWEKMAAKNGLGEMLGPA